MIFGPICCLLILAPIMGINFQNNPEPFASSSNSLNKDTEI